MEGEQQRLGWHWGDEKRFAFKGLLPRAQQIILLMSVLPPAPFG